MKRIFIYLIAVIGLVLLSFDYFNGSPYLKIMGLVMVMFSIYNIQSNIPSKSNKDDTDEQF